MGAEQIGIWAGAAVAVLTLLGLVWRTAVRIARRVDEVVDDWQGAPARPGVPARPGLVARVASIEERTAQIPVLARQVGELAARVAAVEHELHPNGGSSLRDAVDRVDRRTAQITDEGA